MREQKNVNREEFKKRERINKQRGRQKQNTTILCIFLSWLMLTQMVFAGQAGPNTASQKAGGASTASSGTPPTAKTEQTVQSESELKRLTEEEKTIKASIKNETINRAKLLAQKRADLKVIRQTRDELIKTEVAEIKGRKDKQAEFVKTLKKQLPPLKKLKNKVAIAALEATIAVAQIKLDGIDKEYKAAKDRLTKSYQDYKKVYDNLTNLDNSLKIILDGIDPLQKNITTLKEEMKTVKSVYTAGLKNKDFVTAQEKAAQMVQIQNKINLNHSLILDCRKHFKSEYTQKIVNYQLG